MEIKVKKVSSLKGYLSFLIIWLILYYIFLEEVSTCRGGNGECANGLFIYLFIIPALVITFAAFIIYVIYRIVRSKK
jgi:hypothetical protein